MSFWISSAFADRRFCSRPAREGNARLAPPRCTARWAALCTVNQLDEQVIFLLFRRTRRRWRVSLGRGSRTRRLRGTLRRGDGFTFTRHGAIGHVTDCGLHNSPEVQRLGFHHVPGGATVSHGQFGVARGGVPVQIRALAVRASELHRALHLRWRLGVRPHRLRALVAESRVTGEALRCPAPHT